MTTTENYIYRFDAALGSKAETLSSHDLVKLLGVAISGTDPKWNGLIEIVEKNRAEGLNYAQAPASLAVLCQDILAPQPCPIEVFSAATEFDNLNVTTSFSSSKERIYCLSGVVSGRDFTEYWPISSDPLEDFPEVFGNILSQYGLAKELSDIEVRKRSCFKLPGYQSPHYRALLEFFDARRELSWWCVGVGWGSLSSTTQAIFDGYRFALDPRRAEIPRNKPALSDKTPR